MGRLSVLFVVFSLIGSTALALNIPIATRSDFAMHRWEEKRFDRYNGRPSEVGGNAGDMGGRTKSDCNLNFTYTFKSWSNEHSCDRCHRRRPCEPPRTTIRVESFHVTGSLNTTTYLPNDVSPQVRAHEQGHFRINSFAYDQAYFKSNQFARGMLGREFTGNSLEDAQGQLNNCFNNEYREPFVRWWNGVTEAYDRMTDHGKISRPSTEQAVNRVLGR